MDKQTTTNAAISYLFLAPLFLLAKSNPNFGNIFVRTHSKNAFKIQLSFLVIVSIYVYFISPFTHYSIPVINLQIHNIIMGLIYLFFTFLLLRWAYKAQKWQEVEDIKIKKDYLKIEVQELSWNLSEAEKMIFLTSFIPFIWLISAQRYNLKFNSYWTKVGSLYWLFIILFLFTNHPDLFYTSLLIYIIFVVYIWVNLILNSSIVFSWFIDEIPSLDVFYRQFRASIIYFFESIWVIFGKKDNLNFSKIYNNLFQKDEKFYNLASQHLTKDNIIFSNKFIFIPLINLIYLPKSFFDKKSKYSIAIVQWIIITFLFWAFWYWQDNMYSLYNLFLLFPIFLGLANIDSNPYFRIPLIYEIYVFLDKISFGIFSKLKFLQEKKNEVKEMNFKV